MKLISRLKILLNKHNVTNDLSSTTNRFYNINYGGCGLFAYHLSKNLDKLGVRNTICCVNRLNFKGDISEAAMSILNGNKEFKGLFYHVVVDVNGILFDSDGIFKVPKGFNVVKGLNKNDLDKLLKYPMWNSTFSSFNGRVEQYKIRQKASKAYARKLANYL